MQSYISPVIGWVLFGLALTVFLMTLVLVLEGGALVALDNRVQDALKPVRTSDVVKTANVFTQLGGVMVDTAITLACAMFLIWRREIHRAIILLIAVYGLGAVTHALKHMVNRQRPPALEGYFDPSPSFPSDHCAYSAALALCLVILVVPVVTDPRHRKLVTIVLLGLPFGVALCRLLLSMHYLSDTIAGLAVGCAWVVLVVLFFQRLQKSGVM